ncbi:hypothetical protein LAZ67_21000365 [Cordylochernes scorpioides]|uniref:Uncharacterized protein n=1 Tax=Cordylochernes scorpioides TaxID=51811 RepID=A0ABY6LLE0_9ARAC|nr:hypothetical protein LAZ67_21000365 [Cordylochernes scorpioides]
MSTTMLDYIKLALSEAIRENNWIDPQTSENIQKKNMDLEIWMEEVESEKRKKKTTTEIFGMFGCSVKSFFFTAFLWKLYGFRATELLSIKLDNKEYNVRILGSEQFFNHMNPVEFRIFIKFSVKPIKVFVRVDVSHNWARQIAGNLDFSIFNILNQNFRISLVAVTPSEKRPVSMHSLLFDRPEVGTSEYGRIKVECRTCVCRINEVILYMKSHTLITYLVLLPCSFSFFSLVQMNLINGYSEQLKDTEMLREKYEELGPISSDYLKNMETLVKYQRSQLGKRLRSPANRTEISESGLITNLLYIRTANTIVDRPQQGFLSRDMEELCLYSCKVRLSPKCATKVMVINKSCTPFHWNSCNLYTKG